MASRLCAMFFEAMSGFRGLSCTVGVAAKARGGSTRERAVSARLNRVFSTSCPHCASRACIDVEALNPVALCLIGQFFREYMFHAGREILVISLTVVCSFP